jgi:hypothetical protein
MSATPAIDLAAERRRRDRQYSIAKGCELEFMAAQRGAYELALAAREARMQLERGES